MDSYQLSPSVLRTTASKFNTDAGELDTIIKDLGGAVDTLLDGWKGAGSEEFNQDFRDFSAACEKMITCLTERSEALNSSAQLADETQDALRKQWG